MRLSTAVLRYAVSGLGYLRDPLVRGKVILDFAARRTGTVKSVFATHMPKVLWLS